MRSILVAFAVLGVSEAHAQGSDYGLCAFTKKLISARASEFSQFKGAPLNQDYLPGGSQGTLKPAQDASCIHFRRIKDILGEDVPPRYSWNLGPFRSFVEGKQVYDRAVA